MKRVKESIIICTSLHSDSKGLVLDGLILAAESELERISKRSDQLSEALNVLKKRKQAGDPFMGSEKSQFSAPQN
jgi:hypothetical protein